MYDFSLNVKVTTEKVKYNARAHSKANIILELTYHKYISSSQPCCAARLDSGSFKRSIFFSKAYYLMKMCSSPFEKIKSSKCPYLYRVYLVRMPFLTGVAVYKLVIV